MCAKIKICLEKIRKEVFRTGSMFMSNVMSVYFFNRNHYVYGGGYYSLLKSTENIIFTYKERTQWCGLMK